LETFKRIIFATVQSFPDAISASPGSTSPL
jgi:hypothetical protein